MEVLNISKLTKVYGSKFGGMKFSALNDIDLKVESGEFVGIMGPSGSGKTTFLNMVSTIDKPTSGRVLVEGEDITKLKEPKLSEFRRKKLGFVFQDFNLLDTMTLKENIVLPLTLSKTPYNKIRESLDSISDKLGITDVLNKYPYEVSGGQKQRAAAARAVITKPAIVLADEPTGALDSRASKELLNCFGNLNEINGTTILMVTHDAFAASYCRRVIFIKDGRLFNEIYRGDAGRKEFYQKILQILSVIGGDNNAF
jgi:ABC-type antimicrobial peptide transport system, ATPase component